jgi:two-component system response regulator
MTTTTQPRPREILLVDDCDDDVRLTAGALKRLNVRHNLHVVEDGYDAMSFLRREGRKYTDAPRPDLILLDLDMSQQHGQDTLAAIKSDHHLRMIPVVVFTTSGHERDIFTAYAHNANTYIIKPDDQQEYLKAIQSITTYWFHTATHFLR